MSKLNVGVGEDFPLDDAPKPPEQEGEHPCAGWRERRAHMRDWRHRRHMHGLGAIIILPAAAASVTAAILYPLATLGVIGGLGVAAAAHRRRRWAHYREACRKWREEQDKAQTTTEPPKANV